MNTEEFINAANKLHQDQGKQLFDLLRNKWSTVPAHLGQRLETSTLLEASDEYVAQLWEYVHYKSTENDAFYTRGWYQTLYKDVFRDKNVLEIGSGFGIDGIFFASHGANWHFCDIVEDNLNVIRKVLTQKKVTHCRLTYLDSLASLDDLIQEYDFIYCQGSLINTPFDFSRYETLKILQKLKPGGRWIELCYPKERWQREGELHPGQWGEVTDGEGTPWVEWYDLERLKSRFSPVEVTPVHSLNFMHDNFNWFDLRIDHVPDNRDIGELMRFVPEYEPLDLGLTKRTVHNESQVEPVRDEHANVQITIKTPAEQWSYACHFQLDFAKTFTDKPLDRYQKSIDIDLSVFEGHIGVCIVNDNLVDFDSVEQVLDSQQGGSKRLSIPVAGDSTKANLLIRQVGGSGLPSVCRLEAISLKLSPHSVNQIETGFPNGPVINLAELVFKKAPSTTANLSLPSLLDVVDVDVLDREFHLCEPVSIALDKSKSYLDWKMEVDDAQILSFIYNTTKPAKHLEFGTWQGFGVKLCAENCNAEIWTINLPEGEIDQNGKPTYINSDRSEQTDTGSFIGRLYKEAGYAERVHQILEDSTLWDPSEFADGFFDTILIDGGHDVNTVKNDTEKAIRLLKPEGVMMWHDFCPSKDAMTQFRSAEGVVTAIAMNYFSWRPYFSRLFWVRPSFLLIGIKR